MFIAVAQPNLAESSPFYDFRNEPEATGNTDQPSADQSTPETDSEETETTGSDTPSVAEEGESEESSPDPTPSPSPEPEEPTKREADPNETVETSEPEPDPEPETETTQPGPPPAWEPIRSPSVAMPKLQPKTVSFHDTPVMASRSRGSTPPVEILRREGDPAPNSWFASLSNYSLFGLIALLSLVGFAGVYRGFRRRKVRIIKNANHTANKYLNRTRARPSASRSVSQEDSTVQTPSVDTSRTGAASSSRPATSSGPAPGSPQDLTALGIDPEYYPLFQLRDEEGKSLEEISRETGVGSGEVGLVFDLAARAAGNGESGSGTKGEIIT